jgi:hypothetical protein
MIREKIIKILYISIFTFIFSLLFFYPRIQDSKISIPIYNKVFDSLTYEYATQCFPKEEFFLGTKEILYNDCRGEFSEIEINGKKFDIKKRYFKDMESWKSWSGSHAIESFNLTNKNFYWKIKSKTPQEQTVEKISNFIIIILYSLSLIGIWFTRKYSICFVDYFNKFIKIIFKKI